MSNERSLSYVFGEQHKFLPLILHLTSNILPEGWNENNKTLIPYDFCCPTVQNQITNRTCNVCKLYFALTTMMMQHKKVIHPDTRLMRCLRPDQSELLREGRESQWQLLLQVHGLHSSCDFINKISKLTVC